MSKNKIWLYLALSVVLLFAGATVALAAHPNVTMYTASGGNAGGAVAYSPKQTCAGCHINCANPALMPTTTAQFCTGAPNPAIEPSATAKKFCNITVGGHAYGDCYDYGLGDAYSTHVQGVLAEGAANDSAVHWEAYQNKSWAHGPSVGKHMNQGRNETYTNTNRANMGDLYFTSSSGMFGKY